MGIGLAPMHHATTLGGETPRCLASAAKRPRSAAVHVLSACMPPYYAGLNGLSIAPVEFQKLRQAHLIKTMKTVSDNRREWLEHLIQRHGSISALNIALDRVKTDATLSQIRNKSTHNRTGAPRTMGEKIARDIEARLGLDHGTLDGPAPASQTGDSPTQGHQVNEPLASYTVKSWPFLSVTQEDWSRIPFATRQMLEMQIKSLVPALENSKEAA